MTQYPKINDSPLEEEALRLSVLVQLENGTIIRLHEKKTGSLSIAVSQGFSHKKAFKKASSYGNLTFYPPVNLPEPHDLMTLIARFLISFKGVVECLISGPHFKRRKLRDLLGNDTSADGKTIVWGISKVSSLDLSSIISVTPRKGVLTLSEALYPLENMREKVIWHQLNKLLAGRENPS